MYTPIFLSFCTDTIILCRYPWTLYTHLLTRTIPKNLIGTGPTMTRTTISTILHIDLTIGVDIIIQRTDVPTMVGTGIRMRITALYPHKGIRATTAATRHTVMAAFCGLAVNNQALLSRADAEGVAVTARDNRLGIETPTVAYRDETCTGLQIHQTVTKVTTCDISHPTVLCLVYGNGRPAMVVVCIRGILTLNRHVLYSTTTDTSRVSSLENGTAAILFIHSHHDRIVKVQRVTQYMCYLTFGNHVITPRLPLSGGRSIASRWNLVHFQVVYPVIGTGAEHHNVVAHTEFLRIVHTKPETAHRHIFVLHVEFGCRRRRERAAT